MITKLFICFGVVLIFQQFSGMLAKPFLYNSPKQLANLFTSASTSAASLASSALSAQQTNIADLRGKLLAVSDNPYDDDDDDDDDDFFKTSFDSNNTNQPSSTTQTPWVSNIISQKVQKIIQKIQLINSWANPTTNNNDNDDDFQKEQDEFDKEFEEDVKNNTLNITYKERFKNLEVNPMGLGVYVMEILGTFVGLLYGAVSQATHTEDTTTAL